MSPDKPDWNCDEWEFDKVNNAMEKVVQYTLLTLDELLTAVAGYVVGRESGNAVFTSVVTDSRNVKTDSLFVPLIGEFQDGHKYIPQALEKGASVVFVAQSEYEKNKEYYENLAGRRHSEGCGLTEDNYVGNVERGDRDFATFICVKNTLDALQAAAKAYVKKFPKLIRIGITGSSGKTTTKELAVSLVKQKYRVVYSEGNFNSETGLPLSVFKIKGDEQIGIFEMGMNHKGEIEDLTDILRPQYALITNIGTAHIGLLGSRHNIAEEKKKIFKYIGKDGAAFIPRADDFADFLAKGVRGDVIRFGIGDFTAAAANGQADAAVSDQSGASAAGSGPAVAASGAAISSSSGAAVPPLKNITDLGIGGTKFDYRGISIHLPLPGAYNLLNASAAIALAEKLELSPPQIKKGIESVAAMEGRNRVFDFTVRGKKLTVFEDCYNANPDSVEKVLSLCLSVKGTKCLVLGDMLELGQESSDAHAAVGKSCVKFASEKDTKFVFVGPEMQKAAMAAEENGIKDIRVFKSYTDEDIKTIVSDVILRLPCDTFILLKGSHGIGLERVTRQLQNMLGEAENEYV
ncbi:UDP-N-acetylmuramoyl-tripeptide--D-alanyl-D-alanine ligase [Treponema parvum]|uniref:UDP-N-acetylmuramoyl-tripeptide--D-alanyl-D-alanine ligase n=1 Tax=Treponema parvum TaxID=138851 RepID=A0A975ICU6_9SPIR|nr:UDP-N-acetylmuramoyl-tripeptide--D-alanyl-D-alanine ligase [Treponema parvum]QTQ12073.1 UDP-N-acetylmuramoyl-tripeptide--D-alanyl-D-alanine ligase [Treponema parvum]